jgi:hypothetical protein
VIDTAVVAELSHLLDGRRDVLRREPDPLDRRLSGARDEAVAVGDDELAQRVGREPQARLLGQLEHRRAHAQGRYRR